MMLFFSSASIGALCFLLLIVTAGIAAAPVALPGCPETCGNITVPYPFGTRPGCFREGFNLTCDEAPGRPPKLFVGDGVEVVAISLPDATVRVLSKMLGVVLRNETTSVPLNGSWPAGLTTADKRRLVVSTRHNRFVAIGCNLLASLVDHGAIPSAETSSSYASVCAALCPTGRPSAAGDDTSCSGVGCCQTPIARGLASYGVQLGDLAAWRSGGPNASRFGTVFIADQEWFCKEKTALQLNYFGEQQRTVDTTVIPMVLEWWLDIELDQDLFHDPAGLTRCISVNSIAIGNDDKGSGLGDSRARCNCSKGYEGNPYIADGCQVRWWVLGSSIEISLHLRNAQRRRSILAHVTNHLSDVIHLSLQCPLVDAGGGVIVGCHAVLSGFHFKPSDRFNRHQFQILMSANNQTFTHAMEPASICQGRTYAHQREVLVAFQGLITIIAISAGFGLLFSLLGVAKITNKLKQQRAKRLRQKYFKRNHGLLLQQLISTNKYIAERMKIFSLEELEQATNKFDQNRILGGGGHGTVYKGILSDQRVVAIKKSKIVVQREIDQFINEVVILSQINHRNVVKLFGCCLETEVPLLVYEFISNGTLSYHLHKQSESPLSWKNRLRIALETARAVAYLHCAASISVFHRDIKSANILLTDSLTAKVSDFGASRSISINETGVLTAIQGTHGYLDPEYYYTSRLTEKSDVYSFGVILAELLTGLKPVFPSDSLGEVTNLASYFVSLVRDNRLPDILDPQIVEEGMAEDAEVVARLAATCLSLKGEERPTMRLVEMALEYVQGSKAHLDYPVTGMCQNAPEDHSYNGINVSEGTRLYSLEKEFIQSSEIPR
ncbi:hypothetical protein ACP70R_010455 [Stipagrostis hirtigluma subsp. patula]